MTARRLLLCIAIVAVLHGLFFIWYQQPDWESQWTDQAGYRTLATVLANTGKFTRYPDVSPFVPEVIRTPVYPAFVAVVYRLFGTGQLQVALAQTILFVLICLLTYHIAARTASPRAAIVAAAAVALFPPIPYFGALVLTEVWTTFVFTAAMWLTLKAVQAPSASRFAALGVLLAVATLSRPVFVLFAAALALVGLIALPFLRVYPRPAPAHWGVLLAAFGIAMLPWFAYNYVTLGRVTLSPAGGVGRGLWEGSWQASWPGRVQNELTQLADEIDDRAALDARVVEVAQREGLPAGPMIEYVHQWKDIRKIWVDPVDPHERALSRVEADQEYGRVAIENLRHQPPAQLARRLLRGVFVLWAGEIPFRYSDINRLPPSVIRACWAAQALLLVAAAVGLVRLMARGQLAEACFLAAPLVYITAVHFPLLTEARQSLPAMPVVLVLAAIAVTPATDRSLPLKPQIHEREHL